MDNRDITEKYPQPVPVQESPSEIIHNKLLNLRDSLDQVCIDMTGKLSLVMSNHSVPSEDDYKNMSNSDLPPLFQQYNELIAHIELVVDDINLKLNNVDI